MYVSIAQLLMDHPSTMSRRAGGTLTPPALRSTSTIHRSPQPLPDRRNAIGEAGDTTRTLEQFRADADGPRRDPRDSRRARTSLGSSFPNHYPAYGGYYDVFIASEA